MSLADEVDALLQQAATNSTTMHRLGRGEDFPGATEGEMIELLISMSNAMSTAIRIVAAQVDALVEASEPEPR